MRCLGIDFGLARVGLALSDPEGIIASPLKAIEWSDIHVLVTEIAEIISEKAVGTIVIGDPIHLSGEDSEISDQARAFAKILAERFPDLKIVHIDERLTTKQAERTLREAGIRTGHNKATVDAVAASLILQTYLD